MSIKGNDFMLPMIVLADKHFIKKKFKVKLITILTMVSKDKQQFGRIITFNEILLQKENLFYSGEGIISLTISENTHGKLYTC